MQTANATFFRHFDLVSVQPATEKLFAVRADFQARSPYYGVWQQCCGELDVDIVTLDMSQRLPFHVKRQQVGQASKLFVHGHNFQ